MIILNKKTFSDSNDLNEDHFIKICLSPDNKLVPDLHDNLSGKSVWLPANKSLITDILEREELKVYFGVPEFLTTDLGALISKILRKKVLNSISLANKSGNLAIGIDAIKTQLNQKKHCLILVAKEAKSLLNNSFFLSKNISIFECMLEQKDLEKSTGKNNVKYVGILSKTFKKTIQVDLNKLKGFIDNH